MRADRSRLPVPGAGRPFHFPQVDKSGLGNGLRVWTVNHSSIPVVTLSLLIRRGAADDPPGREGLAALTVDMMDEGSGTLSAIEIHEALARVGGQLDSDIGADGTVLIAGTSTAGLRAAARKQALYQLATFVTWVPLVLAVAWLTLARVFSPLATIAATARRIRSGVFDERIDLAHSDAEVAEVAGTINAMLDTLDDIRQAQSRFNADVAHQLVNPVHAILLECDAEGRGARSTSEMAGALKRIDGLARRIEGVCESLLCYSRTAALDPARLRPIDLEPIIAAAIERVERHAGDRGVGIVPPSSGAVIRGDPDLLEEVVVNLLTNAIDHGATGDRIEVTLAKGASRCRMAVIDHGPGVPMLALPKLFDRFHSGKASGGHGIGLALSRRIARSHGGDLVHEATPGGGATFVLFLPAVLEPS